MTVKKFKTYLAGAFCPYKSPYKSFEDWRDFVISNTKNPKIAFYDPRIDSNQLCPATFTMDDAKGVMGSDILFHYRTRGYEDDGGSWEHGIALAYNSLHSEGIDVKKKLIISVDDTRVPFPLHFASSTVPFSNLEVAVEFLDSLKSLEKKDFMRDWMKLLDRERRG